MAERAGSDATGETTIEFFGGLGVIGGSKIMISTPAARVLLDFGLDLPAGPGLFRPPVRSRPGHELADLLLAGQAPSIPGGYDPAQLTAAGPHAARLAPLTEPDPRPTAIMISHAHIDHDGLLGFRHPDVPAYAAPETVRIHEALDVAGLAGPGNPAGLRPIAPDVSLTVGDLAVTALPVDHDVPGAVGFLVETPDGTCAYTGDLNFHRDGGRASDAFVATVTGCDALVTETTMLSFDPPTGSARPWSERQVVEAIVAAADHDDLALLATYPRDLGRVRAIMAALERAGRTVVWPGQLAAFLAVLGLSVTTWGTDRPQRPEHRAAVERSRPVVGDRLAEVSLADVAASPRRFCVQADADDPPALLDLPIGPATTWIHSQGEPLGPFMATWQPWQDWLAALGVATVSAGSSGHATGASLHRMVEAIRPRVVYPIHGFRPERLDTMFKTVLPERGVRYGLGRRVAR